MQYKIKGAVSNFIIDTDAGMVYQLHTKIVKGKEVEYKSKYKGFSDIKEAYAYLSQTEHMPVWKLRSRTQMIKGKR